MFAVYPEGIYTEEEFHLLQYLVFLWAHEIIPHSASSEPLLEGG